MKRYVAYILLCIACVACTNTDTVNILIANRSTTDVHDVKVKVACSEIGEHLKFNSGDSLIVLNEANRGVPYTYTAAADSICFIVHVVKATSQKNYTLNLGEKHLADNLFRFRTASILVDVSRHP